MPIDVNNPYFRTKVLTASREELRMLLIEGGLLAMREGREGLVSKNFEQVYEEFSKAKAILLELIGGMKPEVAPELCAKLTSLYTYMHRLILEASLEKDIAKADEAIELMEYERETWSMLMDQLARERAGEDTPAEPSPRPTHAAPGPPPAHTPLSIEG
ncbi:MAG: flagellar export chaperone FliS [Planctomycetota bacterium]